MINLLEKLRLNKADIFFNEESRIYEINELNIANERDINFIGPLDPENHYPTKEELKRSLF